jgi:twinkle protein
MSMMISRGDAVRGSDNPRREFILPPQNLGKELKKNLEAKPSVLDQYASYRCISRDTLGKFDIGFDEKMGISFPFYENGKLVAVKYKKRDKDGGKFVFRWKENSENPRPTRSVLFNVDNLKGSGTAIVTEGEEDCMVLVDAGLENVVSIPNGCKSVTGEFLDALEPFHDIIICFDNDESGQSGAHLLAENLGKMRCRIVELPSDVIVPTSKWNDEEYVAKDISDFARAGELHRAIKAIEESEAPRHEKVRHISEFLDDLRKEFEHGDRSRGLTTGFPSLDNLIGGRRFGEVVVISGGTGSGKSTLCMNLALHIASQGEGVLISSFEIPIPHVMRKLAQMITGKWFHLREDQTGSSMQLEDFEQACQILAEIPLYFINVFGEMNVDEFVECAAYAKRRLKCRTVILDHVHFMLRSGDPRFQTNEIDKAMLDLKQCAVDNELFMPIVVHPRKGNEENAVININDFRGSSFIAQAADVAMSVWRDRSPDLDPSLGRCRIHVLKCRSEDGSEGVIEMGFKYAAQSFVDTLGAEIETKIEAPSVDESISDLDAF